MRLYTFFLQCIIIPSGDFLLRSSFNFHLKNIRKETVLSSAQLDKLQKEKLNRVLSHASSQSIYYAALSVKGISNPVAWLKNFPVLTKEVLNAQRNNFLTAPVRKLNKHNSSGSSGVQVTVYLSDEEQDIDRATQVLWWEWAGYRIGNPIVQTGMNPKRSFVKRLKDFFFRTKFIMAFSHSVPDLENALAWASKKRQPVLAGYASSLYVLAKLAGEMKLTIPFKTVITWGDKLFDHYRTKIEKTFQAKVYETYGTGEGFKIAAQKDLPYMYIMTNNVYLELLDDEGNEVEDGKMGHVVVTSLNGYAMPLIRYRIGDLAIKLPKDKYPEKRDLGFPLLQRVVGRDTDLVKTQSGKYMVVHSFTGIFEHVPEITQFCVIQRELSGIEIEYVPALNFQPQVLERIRLQIISALGEEFVINFKAVSEIKPTKSGKPQIIQSKLPKADL